MMRIDVHFTIPHREFGRVECQSTYYRTWRPSLEGAQRMVRAGAPTSPGGERSVPQPNARISRLEAMIIAKS